METSDRIDRIERQLENLTSVVSELTTNVRGNTEAISQLRESLDSSNAQLRESINVANDRITSNVQQLASLMARASQRTQDIENRMQEMQANINQILEYLFRQSQNGNN